jgi:hypothetical protein
MPPFVELVLCKPSNGGFFGTDPSPTNFEWWVPNKSRNPKCISWGWPEKSRNLKSNTWAGQKKAAIRNP